VRFTTPTPSPQSSSRSSPIPEVYNTPGEEQELTHLLEVLTLDDDTPGRDFEDLWNPTDTPSSSERSTSQPSSSKSYRSIGLQTESPEQQESWVQPIGPHRRSTPLSSAATSSTFHPLFIDPHNPPVFERRPRTAQYQGTVFVNRNVNAFPPETFLNQTVYFYNSSDDHRPQRVAVTSTRVYYDDFCCYKRPYEFHIRGRIDRQPWPELY
jgi:hypothetical protein